VESAVVPEVTRASYDGAARVVRESFLVAGVERWSTATTYAGDSVTTTQTSGPASARVPMVNRPAVRVFTDATGQVTRQRTYRGTAASGAYDDLTYAYSPVGDLLGLTDQGGNQWTWEYDVRGRQVRSVDPDRGTSTAGYDTAGRVTSTTDARGVTVTMAYDRVDRPTARSSGGVTLASWTYDDSSVANSTGLLTASRRFVAGGSYTTGVSAFDALGRPTATYVTIPGSEGSLAGTFGWATRYNPAGAVAATSSPATPGMAAETRTMVFNPVGRVEGVSGVLAQADYTPYGEVSRSLVSMTAGRFVAEERAYEVGTHRLASQVVSRVGPGWSGSAAPVRDVSYAYTPAGDLAKVTDAAAGYGRTECVAYDWAGRVADAWAQASPTCPGTVPSMTSTLGGAGWYQAAYTYDTLGNRTSVVHRDGRGTRTRTWTYPTPGPGVVRPHAPTMISDQVGSGAPTTTTPSYTAAGDQTARLRLSAPAPNGGDVTPAAAQTLTYDVEGRVASVTTGTGGSASTTSYVYDADGALLVTDTPQKRTVHLTAEREINRDKTTGARSSTEVTTVGSVSVVETGTEQLPATPPGQPGRLTPPVTTRAVTITDPQASGTLQLDAQTLAVTGRRYTDPFGAPIATTGLSVGTWVGDRGYAHGYADVTSGLTQLGARVYDPTTGGFTEPDPVLTPANPAQFHGTYAYAWHNPLTYTDPTGTEPRPIHNKANKNPQPRDYQAPGYTWGGKPSHATTTAQHKAHRATAARYTAQAKATPRVQPTRHRAAATPKPGQAGYLDYLANSPSSRPGRVPSLPVPTGGAGGWRDAAGGFVTGTMSMNVIAMVWTLTPYYRNQLAAAGVNTNTWAFTGGTLVPDIIVTLATLGLATGPIAARTTITTSTRAAINTAARVEPSVGQRIFRVYGGDSRAGGASWSPVDPRSVGNYRDVAGLPSGGAGGATNTGQFVIEGTLNDPAAVVLQRSALSLDGMKGGLPEYIIPNWLGNGSITITRVSGVNPAF
jgi:RHS repeat-associated protein